MHSGNDAINVANGITNSMAFGNEKIDNLVISGYAVGTSDIISNYIN